MQDSLTLEEEEKSMEELLNDCITLHKLKIYKIRYEMILNIKKKRARISNVRRRGGEIDG